MRIQYYVTDSQTPARADPQTLVQVLAAASHRIVIPAVDIGFEDDDPATTPFVLEWLLQTDAGTNGTSVTPQKGDRGYDESIQGTFLEYQTNAGAAEPTSSGTSPAYPEDVLAAISLHRQASIMWVPAFPIIVKGGERVALRLSGHGGVGNTIVVAFTLYCEE